MNDLAHAASFCSIIGASGEKAPPPLTIRNRRFQMADEKNTTLRTLRLKVKPEAYPWLNKAAFEVNHGM